MTWLWHICFSGALLPVLAGAVTGMVELSGSRDPNVRKNKDYSGVVVWLERLGVPGTPNRPNSGRATMVQKHKKFSPHLIAIPVGTAVDFPNFDPIFHNAFSNFDGQIFDVGLYPPGTSRLVRFNRVGVARVFCNIHPAMSAIIVVLPSNYFAISGRSGEFSIPDVPPGEYRLRLFHERASQETLQTLERKLLIQNDIALPLMRISETGYLPLPHKNKYGREYPAIGDDHIVYPGAPK